jgi:hypothetical protein
MLITKHFIFIHMQKTGGVFFRRLFEDNLPPDWIVREPKIGAHAGRDRIPPEYAHLPAITFIRNPWDWYVSWYHWETQYLGSGERPEPEVDTHPWSTLLGRGAFDFGEAVTRACTRREGRRPWEVVMQAWDVDLLTALYGIKSGHNPPGAELPPEVAGRMPPGVGAIDVGRFEHLRDDLLSFLERHDIPAPAELVQAVRTSPPRHGSRRDAYMQYYDEELRELVARNARHVIAEHGYEY